MEASKLEAVKRDMERVEGANRRSQELNEAYMAQAKEKSDLRIKSMEENKLSQLEALQDRLKEHVSPWSWSVPFSGGFWMWSSGSVKFQLNWIMIVGGWWITRRPLESFLG